MNKQMIQKAMFFVSIVFALIVLVSSIYIFTLEPKVENITVKEPETSAYTTSSEFEEFVKSDGTTYNFNNSQNIQVVSEIETTDILYGSYKFNHTGAASIVKHATRSIGDNDQWYSKLSTIPGYEWIARFEKDSLYTGNSANYVSGNLRLRGNSSAGKLEKQNERDKIYKAYLVVSNINRDGRGFLLEEYPVTLIGPNNKYIETKLQNIRKDSSDRYAGYMDVTEFVQEQGYGWYYCCNVPFFRGDNHNFQIDNFAAWKLIVIEESPTVPLRALTLKLGLQQSSSNPGTSIEINSNDIKTKLEGDVTGQILYSLEGADLSPNSNFLKMIIDGKEQTDFYKETGGTTVGRTDSVPMIEMYSINGKRIENLYGFPSSVNSVKDYVACTYTGSDGKTYTINGKLCGSDTDLLDIDGAKTYSNIVIGNGKKSIKFNFRTENCTLHSTAMGLAIDIESTNYQNSINTELDLETSDKSLVITGDSKNIYGNNSGLYDTKTIINLDPDIKVNPSDISVTAYWRKNGTTDQILISQDDIIIEDNTITIRWGEPNGEMQYYTSTGDSLIFTIEGTEVGNPKPLYSNEVSVTGKLYSSGVMTDKVIGGIAKEESYIEYGDITITKNWLDDSNAQNLRPKNITVDVFRNDTIGTVTEIGTYKIIPEKVANTQNYVIPDMLISDDSGEYTYYIVEHDVNLSNGDSYLATKDGMTITNKLTGTTSKTVDVTWEDKQNANDTRPDSLNVEIHQNGVKFDEYNLTVDTEDSYKFEDLPKYDENGKLYEYTAKLTDVPEGYETTYDGLNITNKLVNKNYTVEYYYDGTIKSENTEVITAYYKDKISEYIDKNITGYTLEKEENLPLLIDLDETKNIIKIYYVKDKFNYTVEYYYEGVKNTSNKVVTQATYQDVITEYIDKNIPGFKLEKVENRPLEISEIEENNIMRVYYVKDEFDYTVEYYKDGVIQEDLTYFDLALYEEAIKKYPDPAEETMIGYRKDKVEGLPLKISDKPSENVIRVYYVKDNFDYKVEYYYDGTINAKKTETIESTYQDIIESYIDKNIDGYVLEKTENLPLTITEKEEENIIKVYYVKDNFKYKVEYYYDGILDESKTDEIEATYKDIIRNYVDKVIVGYKFDQADNLPLSVSHIEEDNIIKIYYVLDNNQTKDLNYTVEYYKEGVKVEDDTEVVKDTVHILQPDTITVEKDNINLTNKYPGYKFEKTSPEIIPEKIDTNSIIKVYYIKDNFDYKVEYYYDGIKDETKTETNVKTFEEIVSDYIDKSERGYRLEKTENLPLKISEKTENNIIKVYYVKRNDIEYKVEYYYDNVLDETKTDIIKNQTYGAFIEKYEEKCITGYKYETDTAPIYLDIENNVIKVFYVKDKFDYKIEYYYEGIKDNSKQEIISATYKDVVTEYPDKNITGYKLEKTENLPLEVSENPINNIIKVYYVIDDENIKQLKYTIEYYKDGIKTDENIITKNVQVLEPDTMNVDKTLIELENKYTGYTLEKTEPAEIPSVVNTGDVIKVYYEKDNFDYRVEYYYDGVIDNDKTYIENATYLNKIDTYQDKNKTGYVLEKTENLPLTISEKEEENVIKIYYVKDKFNYTVEYYYDGIKDNSKTETLTATYQDLVENYPDKNIYGYTLEKTENLPLRISENPINNIAKIYYIIDENQKKELSYTVEYYKDGVLSKESTETVKTEVQVLEPEIMRVDKTRINTKNKFLGYKFENTDPLEIPEIVNNGDVIKVYYVFDESQVKELSYTVEYYKDGIIVPEDTVTEKETVHILEPDIMKVNTTLLNDFTKYKGYRISKTDPINLPTTVNTGTVIRIYYVTRTDISYTVKYYYDDILDDTKTDIITNQTYGALIESYTDKVITGYKLQTDTAPIILDVTDNVIEVYYVKDEFDYRVEYYYDGICDNTKTEIIKATYQDVIDIYKDKNITGYKVEREENLPLIISENPINNIIRIYYVKDQFDYKVEYYYDGIRDDTKTDSFKGTYLDVIGAYVDKNIPGYKLESTDNVPLTIKEVSIDNIIRVYYVKDNFDYKVEYYYDGVLDTSKTETSKVLFGSEITTYKDKNILGYTFEKTENLPLVVSEKVENNIVKVYYGKDNFEYKVEYYYDGIKNEFETETARGTYHDVITDYENKVITGYKLEKTENLPLTVTEKNSNNIIKVYYVKADYSYTVNYYYDGIKDESKTAVLLATYQEIIDTYPDKTEYGYKFDNVNGMPLTISENIDDNVIDVYYEKRDSAVKVKYVDIITGREIADESLKIGKALEPFDISDDELFIDGYTLVKRPDKLTGRFEEEEQTFTYYYAVTSNVIVKYIEKDTEFELAPQEEILGYEGKEYATYAKDIKNYSVAECIGVSQGTMDKKTIEVIYYYLQNTSARAHYIDRETGMILDKVVKTGKVGDLFETKAKNFENYMLVEEPAEKTVKMTKEEIVLEYYYARISEGVIEKHIDIMTGEILENNVYPGTEGDYYETSSKKFKGYDIVESMLPINNKGIMTIEPIEIKYYYIRKTTVIVNYVDIITGQNLLNEYDEDSTEVIQGHDGDSYITTEKSFKDYSIVREKYPNNTSGIMKVVSDGIGGINTETVVTYYYVHKSDGVEEQFIDDTTGEIIKINKIDGNQGDEFSSKPLEIPGYDLVEEKLPDITDGEMTIEKIEIKYYYVRKLRVIAEYIDVITGLKLQSSNTESLSKQDSTEIIEGHEGDSYKTVEKEFEDYTIVKNKYPNNTTGTMKAVIKDGVLMTDIKVTYYYVRKSEGVKEEYIDDQTGKIIDTGRIDGNEGDSYTSYPKDIPGYDLIAEKMPTNTSGLMTTDEIVIKYYFIKKAQVTIEYIDRATLKKVKDDSIMNGHLGDSYKIEEPKIKGYELVDSTGNEEGKMVRVNTTVKFWFEQVEEEVTDTKPEKPVTPDKNTEVDKTPNTGDMIPVYSITVILIVIIMNIVLEISIVKSKEE